MKPGWKTSEFWKSVVTQLIAWGVACHAITVGDQATLQQALTEAVVAVFALIKSAYVVGQYIKARGLVKAGPYMAILAGLLWFLQPSAVHAQCSQCQPVCQCGKECKCPKVEKTAFWRHDRVVEAELKAHTLLLQQLVAQQAAMIAAMQMHGMQPQQAPAPQLIVLGGPQQQIPLGGPPRQDIPLGGTPRQDIPLGGPPRQDVPLGGPPKQDLPLGSPPRQDIPLGPGLPPEQQIPLGKPPQGGQSRFQTFTNAQGYSWRPALWR